MAILLLFGALLSCINPCNVITLSSLNPLVKLNENGPYSLLKTGFPKIKSFSKLLNRVIVFFVVSFLFNSVGKQKFPRPNNCDLSVLIDGAP